MTRILLFSTLFPSSARPTHGVFVETRLRELLKIGGVQAEVVAPVAWFPSTHPRHGDKARMAATPAHEVRNGIQVWHPRYPLLPKIGMTSAPLGLALAALPRLRQRIAEGFDFDVIDAHYFYPDGVAAALLAAWLGKPLVITARGSDVNLIANHHLPRRMMVWASRRAQRVIGVSRALVDRMEVLGMPTSHLQVVRNGVDTERFKMQDRRLARQLIGLSGEPLLLSVGNLVSNKGHDRVIDALAVVSQARPEARLVIVGEGPERTNLQAQAVRLGLQDRVHLVGSVPNTDLCTWFSAADVLLLASEREGWPNVLLESLASGTAVVATRVGGVPEILGQCPGCVQTDERDGPALARAVSESLAQAVPGHQFRAHAEQFGWEQTSLALRQIFAEAVSQRVAMGPVR